MMMDNATHLQVVQLTTTNPQNMNSLQQQQQQNTNKSPGEPDHFLTIRLLMQGKVSSSSFNQKLLFPYSLTSGSR
jgi:hypothetical protein